MPPKNNVGLGPINDTTNGANQLVKAKAVQVTPIAVKPFPVKPSTYPKI